MKNLRLRVDKYMESDGGRPPEVFASIYAVDPDSSRSKSQKTVRRESVPISHQKKHFRSVALNPGHYFVEVILPSGEILSDRVDLKADSDSELVLKAEDSPHEWLSWQHLMGNVGSAGSFAPEPPSEGPVGSLPAKKSRLKPERFLPPPPPRGRRSHGDTKPSLSWLTTPMAGLVPQGKTQQDVWTALAKLPTSRSSIERVLNSANKPRPIPLYTSDGHRSIYRVIRGANSVSGATSLDTKRARDFIAVRQGDGIELVSLPMPWILIPGGREAVIELVVQPVSRNSEFATSLTVRDNRLGLLLGFLSSGALGAVQEIANTARNMLYEKTINPLAAAAGAYAMVGNATDSKEYDWHQWVRNLCNKFEILPDGAIQLARLLLRLRRGPSDFEEARNWLKVAYRRGLPFYSLGVRWLLSGLEKVAHSDPEAEVMRQAVQRVALLIHPQSPFTIIRLGKH